MLRGELSDLADFGVVGADITSIEDLRLNMLPRPRSPMDAKESPTVGASLAALSVAG
jgi:hypothetical protein